MVLVTSFIVWSRKKLSIITYLCEKIDCILHLFPKISSKLMFGFYIICFHRNGTWIMTLEFRPPFSSTLRRNFSTDSEDALADEIFIGRSLGRSAPNGLINWSKVSIKFCNCSILFVILSLVIWLEDLFTSLQIFWLYFIVSKTTDLLVGDALMGNR